MKSRGDEYMKKMIMALGYIFLAIIVIMSIGIAMVAFLGKKLDKESKTFTDAAISAIVSEWDVGEIRKRASPEFDETVDYNDLGQYFDALQGLGMFEEYRGSKGEANIEISFRSGYEITADYIANADFEAGSVEIQLSLIKHGGKWQILDLSIRPEAHTEKKNVI
jgi:hypothetical protein